MKKTKYVEIVIAVFFFFFFLQTASAEVKEIAVKDTLAIQEGKFTRIPLTDTAIQLNGPNEEKTFYYEIESTTSSSTDNVLVLHTRSSELLIDPSAVTIQVDGVPVVSKRLDEQQTRQEIVVPLEDDALEKGFHSVTVSFYGILKEGICIVQESSSNWLSIDVQSYFKLSGESVDQQPSLKDYPHRFIGTNKRMTTVVLPNEPSDDTRDSGMKLATYLAEQSDDENSTQVIREADVKNIPGDLIIIGVKDEFESSLIKKVMKKTAIATEQDALSLVRTRFVEDDQQAEVLVVTGESAEAIKRRLPVLLKDRLIEQLSGEALVIQNAPNMIVEEQQYEIPLKKMGIPDLTFDRAQSESEPFFYYAPQAIQQQSDAFFQLYLKRSETLSKFAATEENIENYLKPDVELVVYVNDIPHSVDVHALEESENDLYTVRVPITGKPLNDSHLMSVQFKVSGLQKKDPCVETDENHWIYLVEDSFLAIPQQAETKGTTLAKFPYPFIHPEEETIVSYPEDMTDAEILSFYRSAYTVGTIPNWRLVRADQLSEQAVTEAHVLFLSGINTQPLLQKVKENLLVSYEGGVPALSPFGFIQEVAEQVSWVQESPWNEKRALLVFDRLNEENPFVTEDLLTFLRETNEGATIAVQGTGNEIYTNAAQVEGDHKDINDEQVPNGMSTFSLGAIVGFVALIFTVILLLVIVLRRQGKARGE